MGAVEGTHHPALDRLPLSPLTSTPAPALLFSGAALPAVAASAVAAAAGAFFWKTFGFDLAVHGGPRSPWLFAAP